MDTVVVVLVERRRQRQVGAQVNHGRLVCLGADLVRALFDSLVHLLLVVGRKQVWRFRERGIQLLNGVLARGIRSKFLGAANEDVVRNTTEEIVSVAGRNDCSKLVLQIVTSSSFQADPVKVEPSAPEDPTQPIDVAVESTTDVVAGGKINDALDLMGVNYYSSTV